MPLASVAPVRRPPRLDRTRASYDQVATDYARLLDDELDDKPLERALLSTFAELVTHGGGRRVADLGCGTGRIAAHLHSLGLDVRGTDLSPGMVAVARQRYPTLTFDVSDMRSVALSDGAVGGVVAWYSTVHTPTDGLTEVFLEVRRVLRTGGQALVAFKVGDGFVHLDHAYGHPVALDVHRHDVTVVEGLLGGSGLRVHTRVVRDPDRGESTPQAFLVAQAA